MTRDPRKDPQPGDVAERSSKGGRYLSVRKVCMVSDELLTYREMNSDQDHDVYVHIKPSSWRAWSKKATVLHAAD